MNSIQVLALSRSNAYTSLVECYANAIVEIIVSSLPSASHICYTYTLDYLSLHGWAKCVYQLSITWTTNAFVVVLDGRFMRSQGALSDALHFKFYFLQIL